MYRKSKEDIEKYKEELSKLTNGQIELIKFVHNRNDKKDSLSTFKDNRVNMLFYRKYNTELKVAKEGKLSTFDTIINLDNELREVTHNMLSIDDKSIELFNSSFIHRRLMDTNLILDCKLCNSSHNINGNSLFGAVQRMKNGKGSQLAACTNKNLSSNDFKELSNKDDKLAYINNSVDSLRKDKIKELSNDKIELISHVASRNDDAIFNDKRINKKFKKKYATEIRNLNNHGSLSPFDALIKVNKRLKELTSNLLEIDFSGNNSRIEVRIKCHICNHIHIVDIIKVRNFIYKLSTKERSSICDESGSMNVDEYKELSKKINLNKECKLVKERNKKSMSNYAIDKVQKEKIKKLSNGKIELLVYRGATPYSENSTFIDKRVNKKFDYRYTTEYHALKYGQSSKMSPYDMYINIDYKLNKMTSGLIKVDFNNITLNGNSSSNTIDLECDLCGNTHKVDYKKLYAKLSQLEKGKRATICNKYGKMNADEYKEFATQKEKQETPNNKDTFSKVKKELLDLLSQLQYKQVKNDTNVDSEYCFIGSDEHKLFIDFNQTDNKCRNNTYLVSRMKSTEYFNINTKTNNLLLTLLLDSSSLTNTLSSMSTLQRNYDKLEKEYIKANAELNKLKNKLNNQPISDDTIEDNKEVQSQSISVDDANNSNNGVNIKFNKDKSEVNISISFDK